MNRDACLSTDVAQSRLETRIEKRFALTLPRSDPNGMNVPRALQAHGDEAPCAVDILQFHAQYPVSASNWTPIADALTSAGEQCQNRFVAIGTGAVDQLLNRRGLQDLRERSRNTATESITLSLARRQVTPDHPMAQFLGERVAGGWVDSTLPRAA